MSEEKKEYPKPTVEDFKGNKVLRIALTPSGESFMRFGYRKAQAILRSIGHIKKFVQDVAVEKGKEAEEKDSNEN